MILRNTELESTGPGCKGDPVQKTKGYRMNESDMKQFQPIFYPESVAVIGASDSHVKFGGRFLMDIKEYGFKGSIYPVNPKSGTVHGLKAYASIKDIPGTVDLAAITLPAPLVLKAMQECAEKGVKGVEILSSGFKEHGSEGKKLEDEVMKIAADNNIRVIGPNCFGLYSPEVLFTFLSGNEFPKTPGNVAFFAQSGGVATDVIHSLIGRSVRFSLALSYGNAGDIDAATMLNYFAFDEKTDIVAAYIEGVNDGQPFLEALRLCAARKPVVILKSGLSEQGQRGTLGHTGSMAGSKMAWEAAVKSSGAVMAKDMVDLSDCIMAFNCLPDYTGQGFGAMAGGGARVVVALDAAARYDFDVPKLDEDTTAKIQAYLPPAGGRAGNPVDLANPNLEPRQINPILELLFEQPDIDSVMMFQMLYHPLRMIASLEEVLGDKAPKFDFHEKFADKAEEIRQRTGKIVVNILEDIASDPKKIKMEEGRRSARQYYTSRRMACFDTADQAFSVLQRVSGYYRRRAERAKG